MVRSAFLTALELIVCAGMCFGGLFAMATLGPWCAIVAALASLFALFFVGMGRAQIEHFVAGLIFWGNLAVILTSFAILAG